MVNKSIHTALDAASVTTMAEVRISIDDLDRQIVTLLGERMRFIEAAARIKPEREAVRDQWRVDDVLTKVGETADKVNFSKKLPRNYTQILSNPLLCTNWSISTVLPEIISMAGRTTKWRTKKPAKVKAIEKGSAEVETGEVDTWVY